MNHSPAQILAQALLEASSSPFTAATPGAAEGEAWSVYTGAMPDAPDSVLVLFDTDGVVQTRLLASGRHVGRHGVQLRLRALSYREGFEQAHVAATLLEQMRRRTVQLDDDTYTIDTVIRTSQILSMGQDVRRREEFSLNVHVAFITD
jgi:hypothetical protein